MIGMSKIDCEKIVRLDNEIGELNNKIESLEHERDTLEHKLETLSEGVNIIDVTEDLERLKRWNK